MKIVRSQTFFPFLILTGVICFYMLHQKWTNLSSEILFNEAFNTQDDPVTTVDCKNFDVNIDLREHPVGVPEIKESRFRMNLPPAPVVVQSDLETQEHRKDNFEGIYESKHWGVNPNGDPGSGPGSTFQATRMMIEILHSVVDKLKIALNKEVISLLDSSCGDMFWMPDFLHTRSDVVYTGYDIVQSNIDRHRLRFHNETWIFKVFISFSQVYIFNCFSNTTWQGMI